MGDDLLGVPESGGGASTPTIGFRNAIINGAFDFWEHCLSRAAPARSSTGYAADRWKLIQIGNTAFTTSRQAFAPGQTDVPGQPTYYHRTVVTAGSGATTGFLMKQAIEGVRTFSGQSITVSFYAKADASKNMALDLSQQMGTGGTPSSNINAIGAQQFALTTSWQRFTATVAIPSLAGKTLGTDNNDRLELCFWYDAGSTFADRSANLGNQSGTFDIACVQVEAGSTASEYEVRPKGVERGLCDRYAQRYFASSPNMYPRGALGAGFVDSSTQVRISFTYRRSMRASPTCTLLGQQNRLVFWQQGASETATSSLVSSDSYFTAHSAFLTFNCSGATAGRSVICGLIYYSEGDQAQLLLNAEFD